MQQPRSRTGGFTLIEIMVVIRVRPEGLDAENAIGNTDEDKGSVTEGLTKSDLFEYLDSWGNPIIYFNSRDYKDPTKVEQYMLNNRETNGYAATKIAPKK